MKVRLFYLIIFITLLVSTGQAFGAPQLLRFSQEETLASTRLRLEFSTAPSYRMQISGQRVDLFLAGTDADPHLRLPLENDKLVRTLLARGMDELMVSFLLRRSPSRVHATSEKGNAVQIEMFWDSEGPVRPSVAFRVSGLPAPVASGGVLLRPPYSTFSGRWQEFFKEFRLPLHITIPLFYSQPIRPLRDEGEVGADLERLAQEGQWGKLLQTLRAVELPAGPEKRRTLTILHAEALVRSGVPSQGMRLLEPLSGAELPLDQKEELTYLFALAAALGGDPYLARLRLSALPAAKGPYAPHIRLLMGEISLAIGLPAEALAALQDDGFPWTAAVRPLRDLRLADALVLSGRLDTARNLYKQLLVQPELLTENAFSLRLCAQSFAAAGEDEQAAFLYEELAKTIPFGEAQGLAFVAAALSHEVAGDLSRALTFLNQVRVDHTHNEAGHRAWLKMLDLDVLSGDEMRRDGAEAGYGEIAFRAFRRELREEAAFKRALVLHLRGEREGSIRHLVGFNRDFFGGRLRPESGALLRELVPVVIQELMTRGDDLQALILVEQTREDLLGGGMDLSFFLDVAQAATRLGLFERASRVYLFLLDGPDDSVQKEGLYLPLIELAADRGQGTLALEFSRRYLERYPQGNDVGAVLSHHVRVLREKNRLEEAADLLRASRRPASAELELLAAEVFWEVEDFSEVAGTFADLRIVAPPRGTLLRAEALWRLDRPDRALPLFRTLLGDEGWGDQAAFRAAQLELSVGRRQEGLNLLRHLSEKGKDPLWRRLAGEALATEKM